jgi:hypothetical protein
MTGTNCRSGTNQAPPIKTRDNSRLRQSGDIGGYPNRFSPMHEWLTPHSLERHESALLAAQCARAVHNMSHSEMEGAGKAGCPLHPQSRVQMKKAHEQVTTGSPDTSSFPCATVLTVFFVLLCLQNLPE